MKFKLPEQERSKVITYTIIIAIGALILMFTQNIKGVMGFIGTIFHALTPVLIGIGLAYLLSPPVRRVEGLLSKLAKGKMSGGRFLRTASVILCYGVFIALVAFFAVMVLPQVYKSIISLVNILIEFINANSGKINELLQQVGIISVEGEDFVIAWEGLIQKAMNYVTTIFSNALSITQSIYSLVLNLLVALAVSIYCLFEKERFASQVKKVIYGLMSKDTCRSVIYWMRRSNQIFSGFISGKIIDSLIMGVLCYIGMRIFGMQYPELISTVFGVTNIVPFFGPIVGGVIGTVLLLIIDPGMALGFAVMALILQQLDGNLIGPYILSDSIGLSSFWIMLAILVGGGIFNFAGMLLGAPVFAIIYAVLKSIIEVRLRKRGLPVESDVYTNAPDSLEEYLKDPEAHRPEPQKKRRGPLFRRKRPEA